MTQIEKFIDNIFVALQEKFPNVAIQYQYIIDTHFVKVTPFDVYDSEAFLDLDFELSDKFDESDLEGMLCFITKDSLIELDSPTRTHNPIVSKKAVIRRMTYSSFSKISINTESKRLNDTTKLAA